jgi:DNA recombination protein RmuC|tara:strand:+ start:2393 stop:3700 length:1308 start_codon:yes stop_codon:yes gene_type:complete
MDYISTIIALVAGLTAGFFIAHFKSKSETSRLEERNSNLDEQLTENEQKLEALQHEKESQLKEERERSAELDRQLAGLKSEYSGLQEKLAEQKGQLAEMQEQFTIQFENLANKILEEKSEKFTKQNKESLDQLLNPLGLKLEEFKKKVEETYEKGTQERSGLREQIKNMVQLNQQMSEDAKNLTKALKGDSKAQGNWGEVVLASILEKSGLRKDEEYFTQQSETTDDGRRLQPDVVVKLPDEKFLIVDSKVSLTAFERFTSAEDEAEIQSALKQHVLSVKTHVKGLSDKNYPQIYADKTPDFVLLFIPVEPAFAAALQTEPNLYNEAFEKNIVIVSPSTLLATLFTINTIWKRDRQNKYALEIADRGGALYDKFVLFAESLEEVGRRIEQTQKSYDEAKLRLSEGSGNVIRQVEMLKELGAKATKQLPESMKKQE